jgi:predicted metal-dependent enzyme (double-stranded beta helix superfamily)
MGITVEQFGKQCHDLLKAEPGAAGRAKVRDLLKKVLMDDAFIAKHFGPENTDPRKCLYEDPELKFCIFAHVHTGAKDSPPHDHGPSWAIYGQADGETVMNEWDLVSRPKDGRPGKVKLNKKYTMKRGDAYFYDIGDFHSPHRAGATKLIRIEGENLDFVKRERYEAGLFLSVKSGYCACVRKGRDAKLLTKTI